MGFNLLCSAVSGLLLPPAATIGLSLLCSAVIFGAFFSSSSSMPAIGFNRFYSAVKGCLELQSATLSFLDFGLARVTVKDSGGIVSGWPLMTSFMPPGER